MRIMLLILVAVAFFSAVLIAQDVVDDEDPELRSPTVSISGTINVQIVDQPRFILQFDNLDGSIMGYTLTDTQGKYEMYLPTGWSGTIKPIGYMIPDRLPPADNSNANGTP